MSARCLPRLAPAVVIACIALGALGALRGATAVADGAAARAAPEEIPDGLDAGRSGDSSLERPSPGRGPTAPLRAGSRMRYPSPQAGAPAPASAAARRSPLPTNGARATRRCGADVAAPFFGLRVHPIAARPPPRRP